MRPPAIHLSIALVTRNRPASLRRCLESWHAQSIQPFEIVISDDSDASSAAAVRALAEEFHCRCFAGPKRGLYANRNAASLACAGTHILSADDDHTHPPDFLETVLRLIENDPARIWSFGEKAPGETGSLSLPAELHRSGFGCAPRDESNCAAISDGASVYPRAIFDSGLRYDTAYPFGALWYVWGKSLQRAGWRISVSRDTWVIHHNLTEGREHDREFLERQLCASTYAAFVNALWIDRSPALLCWAAYYLLRRMTVGDSCIGFRVRARIGASNALAVIRKVLRARTSAVRAESPPAAALKPRSASA